MSDQTASPATPETPEPTAVNPPESLPAAVRKDPALAALPVLSQLDGVIQQVGQAIVEQFATIAQHAVAEVRGVQRMCASCVLARADRQDVNEAAVEEAQALHADAMTQLQPGQQPPIFATFLPEAIQSHPTDPIGEQGHMPTVHVSHPDRRHRLLRLALR